MKRVLYLTNIEVPYRVQFFNELAKFCDLTVLYERKKSGNRDPEWSKSKENNYRAKYLHGIKISGENAFSLGILTEVFSGYSEIIVGCFNSPSQILATLAMRLCKIPYTMNVDGEVFLTNKMLKTKLKKFILSGAKQYLAAGEKTAKSLKCVAGSKKVVPYYFSSLTEREINEHRNMSVYCQRSNTILVIGQYFDYKGMDIALEAARQDESLHYKFVGMGSGTECFAKEHDVPRNVELIPFLQKKELEKEYQACAMLVLPSRQECWGLVINEAASFGTPIVSTWGSGAAVEFLADDYQQYLAKPGDAEDLLRCIRLLLASDDKEKYSGYLLEKSKDYSIELSVQAHITALDL